MSELAPGAIVTDSDSRDGDVLVVDSVSDRAIEDIPVTGANGRTVTVADLNPGYHPYDIGIVCRYVDIGKYFDSVELDYLNQKQYTFPSARLTFEAKNAEAFVDGA